ncbi:MAG: hypothetical protein ACFBSG_00960 [Leptolyngbyaceae cyanobacterium]
MNRFILCFLSATVAASLGTLARADMHQGAHEMTETSEETTEGIISPDSQSPNNREVPGEGVDEAVTGAEDPDLIEGIISPNSQSPNNRTVIDDGVSDTDGMTEADPDLTDGIISPDSQSPNNRVIPGEGVTDEAMTGEEASSSDVGDREAGHVDETEMDADAGNGIISPDSTSPNNRAVPGEGAIDAESMTSDEEAVTTDGIISPDSDGPNNRTEVEGAPINPEMMDEEAEAPTDGIISPDSQSPNNRETPDSDR